ncbi:hypothetical protein TPE_1842 [Treponema pedis str. T A4]|uniref:Uncharacterized protein n=1 Tax=Treponema pedis str. T A4 TaxID=1291379 RepID=S6A4B9_9SPIR|nr:hypothetical protein TPE_1842 [Treponema pedis str. T A4]
MLKAAAPLLLYAFPLHYPLAKVYPQTFWIDGVLRGGVPKQR